MVPQVANPLTARMHKGINTTLDEGQTLIVIDNAQGRFIRLLTPRECERLQGFPDGYTLIPHGSRKNLEADEVAYLVSQGISAEEAAQMAADGPRYKALGNSMAVNVMHWICRRIEMVDAL